MSCSGMYSNQGSKSITEVRGENLMEDKPVAGTTILGCTTPPAILLTQTSKYRIRIRGIGFISWNYVRSQVRT